MGLTTQHRKKYKVTETLHNTSTLPDDNSRMFPDEEPMMAAWQTSRGPNRLKILSSKASLKIGTWNVRTMYQAGKAENIAREMTQYNIGILGIAETRWLGSGETRLSSGHKIIYSGHPEDQGFHHTQGVAFMLSQAAQRSLVSWEPHGPRLIEATFKTSVKDIMLRLIMGYAPTNEAEEESKDIFYEHLRSIYIKNHSEKNITSLLGDLNAQVGQDNYGLEEIMGTHALGVMNDNGERMTDFCAEHRLVVGGSIFPHKNIHKLTWSSPDGRTQNQIDHICISKKFRRSLLDVRVCRGADVYSDHHLVIAKVQLKLKRTNQIKEKRIKYNLGSLQNQESRQQFQLDLRNRFQALENLEDKDVEQHWIEIKDTFNNVSQSKLGFKKQEHKPWLSEESLNLIEERKDAKSRILNSANVESKQAATYEYNELNNMIKRSIRKDKREYTETLAAQAQDAASKNNMREVYNITKILAGKKNTSAAHIKNLQNKLLTTDKEIENRWVEHFSTLLNRPPPDVAADITPAEETLDINPNPPSKHEIKNAIKSLKNNKAAGPDNIPAEVLKSDPDLTAEILEPLITKIWTSETFPSDWKDGHITILPKKGDLTKCENHRGIMLLSNPGKVLCRTVLNRLKDVVDKKLRQNQAGFRPSRSCTDQIATLRIIIEQSLEWNSSVYINFIDYTKAFDSLDRDALWRIMAHYGIPDKYISLIKNLYKDAGCRILIKGKLSVWFQILTGVRQGCLISPFLFLLAIDWILKTSTAGRNGLQWTLTKQLDDLDFADDIAALSNTFSQMQAKTDKIAETSRQVGLQINTDKTETMRINHLQETPIKVEGQNLKDVPKFIYLGSTITTSGGTEEDVISRIKKARGAFAILHKVWSSNLIATKTKMQIFSSNVKSVLLYGSETWFLNAKTKNKLQVFVNNCLRRIKRIFWPQLISNHQLWKETGQEQIEIEILKRKWRWLGHTLRKPNEDIAKQALKWNPQGRRKRGRPKTTWRRQLEKELKQQNLTISKAETLARDRRQWRSVVRGLSSTGGHGQ